MDADRIMLVGNLGRAPQAQIDTLRAKGFRVEQSKAGGHVVSRTDMATYCGTSSDLAAFARRIAADNKALDTVRARAALAGHSLETEQAIDGRTCYRLKRAGRIRFAATLTEVEALIARQAQCYSS